MSNVPERDNGQNDAHSLEHIEQCNGTSTSLSNRFERRTPAVAYDENHADTELDWKLVEMLSKSDKGNIICFDSIDVTNPSFIPTYQHRARILKRAIDTLTSALTSLHTHLHPHYLRIHISILPTEILREILEWSECDPMQLRAISRRFYSIVMESPSIWARRVIEMSCDSGTRVETALRCSGIRALDIRFDVRGLGNDWNGSTAKQLFHNLTTHAHRIRSLKFTFDFRCLGQLNTRFKTNILYFPYLRRLTLIADRNEGIRGVAGPQASIMTFTECWVAPRLEEFSVEGPIAEHLARATIGSEVRGGYTLKRCEIDVTTWSAPFDVARFSEFLHSPNTASLTELTISFSHSNMTISHTSVFTHSGAFSPLELNCLQVLKFSLTKYNNEIQSDTVHALTNILSMLLTPDLDTLYFMLDIHQTDDDFLGSCMRKLFREFTVQCTKLKTLHFSLGRTFADGFPFPMIPYLFSGIPSLEHLNVEAQCIPLHCGYIDPRSIPSLKTVTLRRCYGTEGPLLEDVAEDIASMVRRRGARRNAETNVSEDGQVREDVEKAAIPFSIILEACGHVDRKEVEEKCLSQKVDFVWRDAVIAN